MVSPEEPISRIEGVIEQINERQGRLEDLVLLLLDRKADKTEMRLMFVTMITLFAVVIGLLTTLLTKT